MHLKIRVLEINLEEIGGGNRYISRTIKYLPKKRFLSRQLQDCFIKNAFGFCQTVKSYSNYITKVYIPGFMIGIGSCYHTQWTPLQICLKKDCFAFEKTGFIIKQFLFYIKLFFKQTLS